MSENEQELRDEQDRCGYADVRPKEKQHREPPIKSISTSTIQEPTPRYPVLLPPSQQISVDTEKPLIDNNFSKKKSQEKQPQIKQQQQQQQHHHHHHPSRYQSDPINESRHQQINHNYSQPQPNISNSSVTYGPSTSQGYPSTSALKPINHGQMYAPSSSTAPPTGSVQPYVQQAPYPTQQPSYSTYNEPKPDSRQYSTSEISIILDRLSQMESKLESKMERISDLEEEIRALKREKEIPKLQPSRSDVDDYSARMHRRASMGRIPLDKYERQERQFYNNSADHTRHKREDYYNQPQYYYPQRTSEYYDYYDSPHYFDDTPPPRPDIKSSRQHGRGRSRSFGKEKEMGYHRQYFMNEYPRNGYF